jgi:DNA-binding response OmpR family regulator
MELKLMQLLASQPCKLQPYQTVIAHVWGDGRDKDTVHELMLRLRTKIGDKGRSKHIQVRSGTGIVFYPNGGAHD